MSPVGFLQDKSPVQFTSPLGDNALIVEAMDGEESLSTIYTFHLRMVSEDSALVFDDIVGKDVSLSIDMPDGEKRYVHGIVGRFRQGGTTKRFTAYYAEVYPKLWLLTKSSDTRIFQNKTAPDIIKAVLSDHGITDIKDGLTGSFTAREYCVQYQETDFAFISRLMESEGIFYRFEHTADAHTLVLLNDGSSYGEGPSTLRIVASDTRWPQIDVLPECTVEMQVTPGGVQMDDFNFETPATDLLGVATGDDDTLTMYEYPAGATTQAAVEQAATRRLEALELPKLLLRGSSSHADMRPGHTFTLTDHPRSDANVKYAAWRVTHQADGNTYANRFEAFPADVPFRPPRATPAPRVHGCQTAIVVGKAGEEITTDQYGRVKVKFHWDQAEAADETSSCWLRVSQGWAGKAWGMFFLPRIGQEVIVSFLDGDPDRPIVTGCVYNGQQVVPYALPDNQTRSLVKTESSKGGGGFNEIRLEDKKDAEEIFIQAQKDMNVSVLNDQTVTIKNARTVTVQEADDTLKVEKGNRSFEVAGNDTYKVTGERTVNITGKEAHDNGAGLAYTIKEDLVLEVGGKVELKVTGDLTLTISGKVTIKSDGNMDVQSSGNLTQKATGKLENESGQDMTIKAGMNLTQEGGIGIKSKAGATYNLESGGILEVKGSLVKIN
jgi:type VI secretion system secreted protein VgrG